MSVSPPDPAGTPALYQRWENLLFLHWEIDATMAARRLPQGLTLDTFAGKTYAGLIAFSMRKVRPRGLPWLPWISNFLELNVRLYVKGPGGRPGVYFLSLDCDRALAVKIARARYHLPYEQAAMSRGANADTQTFSCQRKGKPDAAIYQWRNSGSAAVALPGTLEYFFAERYSFFAATGKGDLRLGDVRHEPYRLNSVTVGTASDLPLRWSGLEPQGTALHAMASPGVDVRCWSLKDAVLPQSPKPLS